MQTNTKETLRAELETTRQGFHTLLDSLSDQDMACKGPGSPWNVKAELAHVVQAISLLPNAIHQVRRGRAGLSLLLLSHIPLRDQVNGYILVPLLGRMETRRSLAEKYNRANARIVLELETVQENEWACKAKVPERYASSLVELFHHPNQHFQEHAKSIRKKLENRPQA